MKRLFVYISSSMFLFSCQPETKPHDIEQKKQVSPDTVTKKTTQEDNDVYVHFNPEVVESKFIRAKSDGYATYECTLKFLNPTSTININSCKISVAVNLKFKDDYYQNGERKLMLPDSNTDDFGITSHVLEKTDVANLWLPKTTRSFKFVSKPLPISLFKCTPPSLDLLLTYDFKGKKLDGLPK